MNEAVRPFGEAGEVGERLRWTHGRATWGEALLAALPNLLFALATELARFTTTQHCYWSSGVSKKV